MTAIVFETPGLIDVRAFTTMGLSAKPNSTNPIGYFGTGLKYSIATLLRMGASVVVWIGKDRHEFFVEKGEFRGVEYEKVRMKRLRWSLTRASIIDLPFTLTYGRNWEAWQAYRELESNTRDEGGQTVTIDRPDMFDTIMGGPKDNTTMIIVDHPLFFDAWSKRDEVFLPGAPCVGQGVIASAEGPKSRFYWRGLRVLDLNHPATFNYNVLDHMKLTEDRTLPEWDAKRAVANWLLSTADEEQIEAVLTCDDDAWEYELNFPSWVAPSAAFRTVAERCKRDIFPTARAYYAVYAPPKPQRKSTTNPWVAWPLPWQVSHGVIMDANDVTIFEKPAGIDEVEWRVLAEAMIKRVTREKVMVA